MKNSGNYSKVSFLEWAACILSLVLLGIVLAWDPYKKSTWNAAIAACKTQGWTVVSPYPGNHKVRILPGWWDLEFQHYIRPLGPDDEGLHVKVSLDGQESKVELYVGVK